MARTLKLDELANRAGVSARTVRYYIQRGLLPAPEFRGPDTGYDERHLAALQAIRRLQDEFLPLDAIASALHGKSSDELRALGRSGALKQRAAQSPRGRESAPQGAPSGGAVHATAQRGTRHELAEGVELWVADDHSVAARELVDALLALSTRHGARRQGDKS